MLMSAHIPNPGHSRALVFGCLRQPRGIQTVVYNIVYILLVLYITVIHYYTLLIRYTSLSYTYIIIYAICTFEKNLYILALEDFEFRYFMQLF